MGNEVLIDNPDSSGGLEELYTDFDAWITKRSWKFRHRTLQITRERIPEEKVPSRKENVSAKTIVIDIQDCLVNGFSDRKEKCDYFPEDIKCLAKFSKDGEELAFIDFVLVRLIKENGRRRILFVNRCKL